MQKLSYNKNEKKRKKMNLMSVNEKNKDQSFSILGVLHQNGKNQNVLTIGLEEK